jgi:hypothetical protein
LINLNIKPFSLSDILIRIECVCVHRDVRSYMYEYLRL